MQVKEALKFASQKLKQSSTPNLDARLLLGLAMNMSHEQLLLNYNKNLSQNIENNFLELVARRQKMEPIAYILGQQEFYGLDLFVNENVLIPRPDTELLIDIMIEECRDTSDKKISILELGTGSGAISIALAKNIVTSQITAIDISNAALEVARKNACKHNVLKQIDFIQSDWYQNVNNVKYDFIISNPPYIGQEEKSQMAQETYLFEPELALYSEDKGLAHYKTIICSAKQYLKPGGKLLLEIGYLQKDKIFSILQKNKFKPNIQTDLSGHDRVIISNCV